MSLLIMSHPIAYNVSSNSCWDILVWTKVVGSLTYQHYHPLSHQHA